MRIQYRDQPDFEHIARQFGIFEEWKVSIKIFTQNPVSVISHRIGFHILSYGIFLS